MKNLTRIGFFLFTILICTPSVHATDYNYLPADVGIKQNETLSALEYRLQTLEAQLANNPEVSINTIESRIRVLESERDTEKRYVTGLYGSYGIGSQLEAKLAEIDAKYASEIAELEDQKDEYESQASNLAKAEREAEQLRAQIRELQKLNLELLDEQINTYSTPEVFTDTDIYEGFLYMDSLPLEEASAFFGRIKASRPDVAERVATLYYQKYPHGKPGTAEHDEYLASLPQVTGESVEPSYVPVQETVTTPTPEPETAPVTIIEEPKEEFVAQPEPAPQVVEEPKPTFVQSVVSFFKRLVSWW